MCNAKLESVPIFKTVAKPARPDIAMTLAKRLKPAFYSGGSEDLR